MKKLSSVAIGAALALLPVLAVAQGYGGTPVPAPSSTPSVAPATVQTGASSLGTFLTDAQGNSLYVFLADTPKTSNCSGACTSAWPPLTVANGQTPTGSGGVQSSMLGTIQRSDGTTQVTYGGRPLYKYAGDTAPGMTNGEGLNQFGAEWYLVKPDGTNLEPTGS